MTEKTIDSLEELRDSFGFPSGRAAQKEMHSLDKHSRAFIELSPFLIIATATETGADASPKGDPPGFVKVLGDNEIFIPDRPGNNRVKKHFFNRQQFTLSRFLFNYALCYKKYIIEIRNFIWSSKK